jgi:hypothetical protein
MVGKWGYNPAANGTTQESGTYCISQGELRSVYIYIAIWLFNIAMENPLQMEVASWENHL